MGGCTVLLLASEVARKSLLVYFWVCDSDFHLLPEAYRGKKG